MEEARLTAAARVFPGPIEVNQMQFSQGAPTAGRPDEVVLSEIRGGTGVIGYCVERDVVARSGPFRIRILLDKDGVVKEASVVKYRWTHGRGVMKSAFTGQFTGKGPADPVRIGNDIDGMTGATISSGAMADGVRQSIKLIKSINKQL